MLRFDPATLRFSVEDEPVMEDGFHWNTDLGRYVSQRAEQTGPGVQTHFEVRLDADLKPTYFREQREFAHPGPYDYRLHECYDGIAYRPPVVATGAEHRMTCTTYDRYAPNFEPIVSTNMLSIVDGYLMIDGERNRELVESRTYDPVSGGSDVFSILPNGWYRFSGGFSAKGGSAWSHTLEFTAAGDIRHWRTTSGFVAERGTSCVPA